MHITKLKRVRKAYVKLLNIWTKSNDSNKTQVMQDIQDSIDQIDLEIELTILSEDDTLFTEVA